MINRYSEYRSPRGTFGAKVRFGSEAFITRGRSTSACPLEADLPAQSLGVRGLHSPISAIGTFRPCAAHSALTRPWPLSLHRVDMELDGRKASDVRSGPRLCENGSASNYAGRFFQVACATDVERSAGRDHHRS